MSRNHLVFLRNGRKVRLDQVGPNETLLDYLRLREGSKGTKEGCNEGDCGACTVAIGRLKNGNLIYESVNACIQLLGQVDGKDVVTIDDLANDENLHPVQQAMVDLHGSQCGFCTPGIVMSLFTLYHEEIEADRQLINDWLSGNLCRCTGYRPIADSALAVIKGRADDALSKRKLATRKALKAINNDKDLFLGDKKRFFAAPASTRQLAKLYRANDDATIVSGATDVGLWITKQLRDLPKIIYTGRANDFAQIKKTGSSVRIGAGATYADAFDVLSAIDPDIGEVLRRLGSRQVRASGTIGGNIANGSPIGDMPPMLIALGCDLELVKGKKSRTIPLEKFFIDYGKQDRAPGELVSAIYVPGLKRNQQFRAYKISKRYDQDISSVLAAFRYTVSKGKITEARIAFGGMAATPKRGEQAEAALEGKGLNDIQDIEVAVLRLAKDFQPISDMRASAAYRLKVAQNLMRKSLIELASGQADDVRIDNPRKAEKASS
ncbi:MAG: xanthine dehydrogenase small subunit [Rhizobiaceae bacterium]